MALLPVPALAEKHARNSSASIGSGSGSYTSFSLFLHSQCRKRSSRLAIANIAEVHQDSQQRQHWQSATRFKENGKKRKSSPPGNPSHNRAKQHAPARDARHPRGGRLPVPWRQREGPQDDRCNVEDAAGAENSTHGLAQRSAMARIVEKLRDMQKAFHSTDQAEAQHSTEGGCISDQRNVEVEGGRILPSRTAGELFLPKPNQDLFSIGSYWSTPDHPVPAPGRGVLDTKFPWELDDQDQQKEEENKRVKPLTLAELTIPPDQLRRLRSIGIQLQNPVRVGRLGVTDNIADGILGRWRSCELVKVKCEGPAVVNMMKIHRDLERKTGGFVIWRAGSVAVVYRGSDYDTANRVASSLERKLEGLISSGRLNAHAKSTLHDMNKADAKKVLHEVSEATWNSKVDTQSTVLQFDVSGIDQEKDDATDQDLILPGKLTNGHARSTLHDMNESDNDEVLHETSETTVDSRIEANSIMLQPNVTRVGQEKGDAADVNTDLGIVQTIRRLNVTPDPYIDREYEMEVEGILEGLGPRCQDWTGLKPAPVDADLLPPTIPNYRPPYRLLPYGVKPKLSNHEQTNLRRLVRPMAPHFALGRNKGQQGLAVAILKLWERSEVAKIAVKTGVQNTSSEKMAEELKRLTGGVLLARDKYFITLYRGKDFLPQQVALALTERTSMLRSVKEGEESIGEGKSIGIPPSTTVTTEKALEGKPEQNRVKREAAKARCLTLAGQLERKLSMAVEKKEKAEQDLEKLEGFLMPVGQPADSETITEEERFMYRRLGLKMSAFLLVGRRGVFDGLVENMHLHWKHRELVKLIVKERDPVQLQKTARMLEYESGGVLIAVVSTSKGQAIIMYRGKNYQRPSLLRPHNLLTKKKALERSLEMQRHVSLSKHIQALEEEISKMKAGLTEAGEVKDDISHVALGGDCSSLSSINLENDGVHEDEQGEVPMTAGDKHSLSEDGTHSESPCANKKELVRLVGLGPIYRADPLTNLERLKLRREALKLGVGARFNVGKSNVLVGLARALRVHFLSHALVVIGVKNRGRGTSVQDLVHELEDLTGGVLVSQEPNKIIMYRGWPSGERMPMSGSDEELSPELRAALEAEEDEWDLVDDDSFLTSEGDGSDVEGEADEDDDMGMLFDEADGDADEEYDSTQQLDSDHSSIGKQDDELAEV